jgi:hypothetical protein
MARKNARYALERQLPSGEVKVHPGPMKLREAGQAVAYCLLDNGAAGRSEATAAAMKVEVAAAGEWVEAPGGYRFRLVAQ